MDHVQQLRNLKDFLLVYNRMTEICFQRCTTNFNYRALTMDEERCVDSCAGKLIRSNHRLMGTYVQLMPAITQRRMEEMEKKAAELEKAEAQAAAAAAAGTTSSLAEVPAVPTEMPPSISAPVAATDAPAAVVPSDAMAMPVLLTSDAPSTALGPDAATEAVPRLRAIVIPAAETPLVNGPAVNEGAGNGAAAAPVFVLPRMPAPELSPSVASEVAAPMAALEPSTPVSIPSAASIPSQETSLGIPQQKIPPPLELPSTVTTPAPVAIEMPTTVTTPAAVAIELPTAIMTPATAAVELPTATSVPTPPVAVSVPPPLRDSITSVPDVVVLKSSADAIAPAASAAPVLSPPSDTAPGSQSSS